MRYYLEVVPRFGSEIGIVWKEIDTDDKQDDKQTIGHIRFETELEKKLWLKIIQNVPEILAQLMKELENEIR